VFTIWMKNYLLLMLCGLATLFVILAARKAYPSPLDCEGLHNADQRNYCRALTKHEPNYCEVIKDQAIRATCRALVRK
jgi:hypothetical protein